MSLAEACGWSFARAVLLGALCLPIGHALTRRMVGSSKRAQRALTLLLLVPFLMPELLIGFVYSETTLRLTRELSDAGAGFAPPTQLRLPQQNTQPLDAADIISELLYSGLLILRFAPVAALTMWLLPTPRMSAEAVHCRRLLVHSAPRGQKIRTALESIARGPLQSSLPAFAIVFLLVFQEFEIASLMQVSRSPVAWTVWLFDNHAGGLMLSHSLRLTFAPLLCECLVVGAVIAVLMRQDWQQREPLRPAMRNSALSDHLPLAIAGLALLFVAVVPMWRLSSELAGGLPSLLGQPRMIGSLATELFTSLAFATASALTAFRISGLIPVTGGRTPWLAVVLSLPGLIGALVLSLLLLWLFQLSFLNALYDTPIPMLLGLTLFLLPRAVLLRLLLRGRRPREAEFTAELLRGGARPGLSQRAGRILYVLRTQPALWATALLAYWSYWDLTIASILRPTQLEPFTPGLYNLMHYGRNETLAAMALLAGVFPFLIVGVYAAGRFVWNGTR